MGVQALAGHLLSAVDAQQELEPWAERVRTHRHDGLESFVYFNNDPGGLALTDADHLRSMVGEH